MRKKTPSVAFALATGIAVLCPFASCSSGSSGPPEDAGSDLTSALTAGKCGDGVLNIGEQCDLGPRNGIGADGGNSGCDKHCNLFCIPDTLDGNAICDDHNPCNGVETCAGIHNDAGVPPNTCAPGVPLPDGTACGTSGAVCKAGVCGSPSVCGDGVVQGTEECDLGARNGTGPDGGSTGCGTDCRWTCVVGDTTRDCASTNPCVGQGTCDPGSHVCAPGANVTDGTSCGNNQVCKNGRCQSAQCGDNIVEPPEQCDFGKGNGLGTGCESNCTFSCSTSPNDCVTSDSCAGLYSCAAVTVSGQMGQKCELGQPPAAGTACMGGGMCVRPDAGGKAYCSQASCGNGVVDAAMGEDCDWGSMNGPGVGCELDCKFSCSTNPLASNACPGLDPCSAMPQVCQTATGPGNDGQKCVAATTLSMCASCGGGAVCVSGACKTSSCGDTCIVPPEQCDPPDGVTCDTSCQKVVCGDGKLGGKEQCDDGNTTNLDGCDSSCNFEQLQRSTQLKYSATTDAYCPLNALGVQIITAAGLSVIQSNTDQDVMQGNTNVIFKFMGTGGQPADLSGTSGNVLLGSLSGLPEMVVDGGAYNGNSDLDWWYAVDPATVDPNRNPLTTSTLNGSFSNKVLSAGPGLLGMKVNLSGSPAALSLWNAKIKVAIGPATAPTVSTGGSPGHLASENILSTLTSFSTAGVGGSGPTGELCGNITAQSLAGVVTPPLLTVGAATACDEGYTSANSLLDVLVHGCTLQGMGVMNASQPDQQQPGSGFPSGTVAPYKLSASSSTTHKVDTCKDSSSPAKTVTTTTCLAGLAYSSAFTFQTDRVIIKP